MPPRVRTFEEAEQFLLYELPRTKAAVFKGGEGFSRAKELLARLGNPQDAVPAIHIAGTSGKGSVAYMTASLLKAAGKNVGLHVSPHVLDIRERIQINGRLITKKEFSAVLNDVLPHYEAMKYSPLGPPTFFEVTVGMAFLVFQRRRVDYAVIETGLGGRFDASNAITRQDKVAVLTRIGLDHTAILGRTYAAIARQKAGIIQPKIQVIALKQRSGVNQVFKKEAVKKKAALIVVDPPVVCRAVQHEPGGARFDLKLNRIVVRALRLGVRGMYQVENAALALKTAAYLGQRDRFPLTEKAVRTALRSVVIPGRFDVERHGRKTIVFDAAHNPQKMQSFVRALALEFPASPLCFVVAMVRGKDSAKTLKALTACARHIIFTSFSETGDFGRAPTHPRVLKRQAAGQKRGESEVIPDPRAAFQAALRRPEPVIVVTGSFYLLKALYKKSKASSRS